MKQSLAGFFLLFAGISALACPQDSTSNRPATREIERVRLLLYSGKFAELDALDARSRDIGVHLSDGQPLRASLMAAVATPELGPCRRSDDKPPKSELLAHLEAHRKKIAEWREANPAAATPRLVEAELPMTEALILRGGDYARDVPPEVWPVFEKLMRKSGEELDALPANIRNDGAWYTGRLAVMLYVENRDAYNTLLREGLDKFPTYTPLYFAALESRQDKWRGSWRDRHALIEEAVRRTEPTMGQTMYARLHWAQWNRAMFRDNTASWDRMKTGFDDMVKDYPDPWNLNHFAKFACLAQDADTLKALLERIRGKVVIDAWETIGFYKFCVEAAELNAGRVPSGPAK